MPTDSDLPVVDVLIATCNGEKFLSEQLSSILMQEGVKVRLFVSDDGSIDGTLEILQEYKNKFNYMKVFSGPRKGPAANFLFLLSLAQANFIAFADQDDIWESRHLINAVGILSEKVGTPSLCGSNMRVFFQNDKRAPFATTRKLRPPKYRFFENVISGCTIVMNLELAKLLRSFNPKSLIMHDYWAYLVASCTGTVTLSEFVSVNYRIHDSNYVGIRRKLDISRWRELISREWVLYDQLAELHFLYHDKMLPEVEKELSATLETLRSGRFTRLSQLVFRPYRFRQSVLDEILLRLRFLFFDSKPH